jgi:hypothetical protein
MKTAHWLLGALAVPCLFSGWFLCSYRVENDIRVGTVDSTPVVTAFSHERFNRVLQGYVDAKGQVNYRALKKSPKDLEAYLDQLAATSPEDLPRQAQLSFWINAYNALTIKGVIDHYPTKSVRKVKPFGGFFSRIKFQVGGKSYTLNDIEHDIIRGEFIEPRIHFALVCASGGCPILASRAFAPDTLDEQLDDATFNFINTPEKVRLDRQNRVLYLSKIFEWYEEDFKDTHDSMRAFIADYLSETDATFIEQDDVTIRYLDYDWTLNDQALKKQQ